MGHVFEKASFRKLKIEVSFKNLEDKTSVEEIALIDTGSTYTILPERIAKQLKLPIIGKRTVKTAKGRQTLKLSYCLVEIKGEKCVSEVLISKTLDEVLIGVITLETLRFKVNPTTGELEKVKAYLL